MAITGSTTWFGPQPTFRNFWLVLAVGSLRPTSLSTGPILLNPIDPLNRNGSEGYI